MIIQPDEFNPVSTPENLETVAVYIFSIFVVVVGFVKASSCFGGADDDDEGGSTVESFTISPWTCFCNWFKTTERLGWSQDDARFTTYSVKSMNITTPDEKPNPKTNYLPNGVDGVGTSTRKYLDAHGSDQQLPQTDRRKLEDNRVIMKAYLISKLVAARYSFEDGTMEFEERAEDREIEDYKERTQAMYDLLYSGQITVDTRATRRQQRVALKRLRKSNLNLRPSKIRELARQMKEEAEKDRCSLETGSSGIGSTCDISKAETTTVADSNRTGGESRFSRFLQRMGLRSSRDSAVGSSLGSVDRLGGVAVIDVQETNNWSKVPRTCSRAQPLHTYGGAQF